MYEMYVKLINVNEIQDMKMAWNIHNIAEWELAELTTKRDRPTIYGYLKNDQGIYRYRLVGGIIVPKTSAEILAELNGDDKKLELIKDLMRSVLEDPRIEDLRGIVGFNAIGKVKGYNKKADKIGDVLEEAWFDYIENVATFTDNGFDIANFTVDPAEVPPKILIDINMFGPMPAIPDIYSNLEE